MEAVFVLRRSKIVSVFLSLVLLSIALTLAAPPARAAGTTYTWNQTGTASWAVSTNWTPERISPATTDVLQFNGGGTVTVTNIPSQTIGQLLVSNNTTVNLQADANPTTLTIGGDTGTDLDVPAGSALNLNGATNALTVFLAAGATGSISGNMTCSTATHKLNAQDAGAITFNSGATLTQDSGCTSNVFTNSGTANVIIFASGSTFVSKAGSNPFGLTAPGSKVTFQAGSLFRHQQSGFPSLSNRTYANFEMNYNTTFGITGTSPWTMDDLTVTQGVMNITTALPVVVKGNLSVASGQTLNYSPGAAATFSFNGTGSQAIGGSGTLVFGSNSTVAILNTLGATLARDVTMSGALALTSGDLNTGGNTLTLTGSSVTGSGDVVGNVKRLGPFSAGTDYPFNNANTLINFGTITSDPGDITINLAKSAPAGLTNAIARQYSVTPTSVGTFNASLQLGYKQSEVGALVESALRPWKNEEAWTVQPGSVNAANDFVTASGVTSFSNWAIAESSVDLPTDPSGSGAATPPDLLAGFPISLTVAVTPGTNPTSSGLGVTCNLTAIGGSSSQTFYDNGSNGDAASGDNVFTYSAIVPGGTSAGAKSLPCSITDGEARTGYTAIAFDILSVLPIGTVNGAIADGADGTAHQAAYKGQTVNVRGVIYEKTLQAIKNTTDVYYGFFIQNTTSTADGNANTSDGLYVFMNKTPTMSAPGATTYTPTVGDEVALSGSVTEYYDMTELQSPTLLTPVLRHNVVLDTEVPAFDANPPANLADANRYWERRQGMRGRVPQNSIVLNGRNVFNPADGEVWVTRPNSTIAGRSDPYARRAFRDAHPLDDNYSATNWDGNGYRILMGSWGIKSTLGDGQALIAPAHTFNIVTNSPVGGVNYSYSKYRIEVSAQPTFSEGTNPAANNPPQTVNRSTSYSIVDYNLENLYDYRNNPASGCDFAGDSGCSAVPPFTAAVNPPYDYVPASDAAYQARLTDIAKQIINDLHSPDILMLQEIENQDICTVTGSTLTCGTTDNADGKPDVLQELALKIASLGGPAYGAAFDRNSSDLRGILPAFMYRTDRVQLLPATGDPILGANPAIVYAGAGVSANADVSNPKTLNAVLPAGVSSCETNWVFPRAPSIGLFRIYRTSIGAGNYHDVYVINNHFKSGPDTCVAHRTEQAKYNAAIVAFIQAAKPNARIVLGGDLNVYPRPDDPFAPIGQPSSSDQLGALYGSSLGLKNLWEVLKDQAPAAAYSYVYVGMAQTLDQMFVNQAMLADLQQFRIAHINSDYAADYSGDVARGTSDHDPNVATFLLDPLPNKLYLPYTSK